MGLLFSRKAQYPAAEPLHQRALAICEKTLGPEHLYVATCLNNLAVLGSLGADHPSSRIAKRRYVDLLQATGKTEEVIARDLESLLHRR